MKKNRIDSIMKNSLRKQKIVRNSIVVFLEETRESVIIPPASEDIYYRSIRSLKLAISKTMKYRGHKPENCSWFCGNEPELSCLAQMAGIRNWVQKKEMSLNMKYSAEEQKYIIMG